MIVLDCGIELPEAPRASFIPSKKAYEHCVSRLPEVLGGTLASVTHYIHAIPEIGLRFLGEMEIAGYVRFKRKYAKQVTDSEVFVEPTKKFNALGYIKGKAIKYPSDIRVKNMPPTRRGVGYTSQPTTVMHTALGLARIRFTINEFALEVQRSFPAVEVEEGGFAMYCRAMNSADKLKGKGFYFPQFLDSRGRIYIDTTCGITPQGADYEKALLLPCYAEALTPEGYLALLETLRGYSEKDWDVLTMLNHSRNWKVDKEWMEAESPYCYLAMANLLDRFHRDPKAPIPAFIPLDGRCSGLQHWSAMTRSTSITNRLGMELEEAPDGMDIYEYVAKMWEESLPEEDKHFATRKAAKVPTMTWGYNATRMTSIEHLQDLFPDEQRKHMALLGSDLYNRLHETFKDLTAAVQWVGECAKLINRDVINWTTPDGFIGQQKKVEQEDVRIRAELSNGVELKTMLKIKTTTPSPRKHASALSPNIIHSMDATHLRMVAKRMQDAFLPTVFIHDSFATHVNHRATLYKAIVEEFYKLYSGNYLEELYTEWTGRYEVELPKPPSQGDWDVATALSCERFFV